MKMLKAALALPLVLGLAYGFTPPDGGGPCTPKASFNGDPCIGQDVEACIWVNTGCGACLMLGLDGGPTTILGIDFPLGNMINPPLIESPSVPPPGDICVTVTVPDIPALVGLEIFFLSYGYDPMDPVIEIGSFGSFTICDCPDEDDDGECDCETVDDDGECCDDEDDDGECDDDEGGDG